MPPVGLEATIAASAGPQTYALDRAATGTGELENAELAGRSPAEIVGSNPTGGMDICLL